MLTGAGAGGLVQGSTSDNFHEILFTCSKFMQSAIATKMHADALRQVSYFENASKVRCGTTNRVADARDVAATETARTEAKSTLC
jgi:hypothetical protein